MSFYTNNIRTDLIDPIVDNTNNRTEFRLTADTLYLSNLRIANLGLTQPAKTAYEYFVNELVGDFGIIRRIELLDGSQKIDSVNEFGILQGFRNYNNPNENNKDLNNRLSQNALGFTTKLVKYDNGATPPVVTGKSYEIIKYEQPRKVLPAEKDTARGWLSLIDVFPVLKQMEYIHTGLFKDFRIVIEYVSDVNSLVIAETDITPPVPDINPKTTRPLLIADVVLNQSLQQEVMKSFKGVVYKSFEVERIVLPANPAAGESQTITQKLQAFNNRRVNKMLLTKNFPSPSDPSASAIFKNLGSEAMPNQKLNVRVNGKNIFARDGIISDNERLGLLHTTFGTCNTTLGNNLTDVFTDPDELTVYNNPNNYVGRLDYFGWDMFGERVQDLEITYTRGFKAGENNRYIKQLFLHVFGECVKMIVRQGDSLKILYM